MTEDTADATLEMMIINMREKISVELMTDLTLPVSTS
jgi:hypothetical protein